MVSLCSQRSFGKLFFCRCKGFTSKTKLLFIFEINHHFDFQVCETTCARKVLICHEAFLKKTVKSKWFKVSCHDDCCTKLNLLKPYWHAGKGLVSKALLAGVDSTLFKNGHKETFLLQHTVMLFFPWGGRGLPQYLFSQMELWSLSPIFIKSPP